MLFPPWPQLLCLGCPCHGQIAWVYGVYEAMSAWSYPHRNTTATTDAVIKVHWCVNQLVRLTTPFVKRSISDKLKVAKNDSWLECFYPILSYWYSVMVPVLSHSASVQNPLKYKFWVDCRGLRSTYVSTMYWAEILRVNCIKMCGLKNAFFKHNIFMTLYMVFLILLDRSLIIFTVWRVNFSGKLK